MLLLELTETGNFPNESPEYEYNIFTYRNMLIRITHGGNEEI